MLFLILPLTFLMINCQNIQVIPVHNPNNITISYGSCFNTYQPPSVSNKILESVVQTQPDLWMWVGDAVYLDGNTSFLGTLPGPEYDITNGSYVKDTLNTLKTNPVYAKLRRTTPIIGTWDDHDFCCDGGDSTFEYKQRNMGLYLDFIDEPLDSPRRNQQGLYTSYYIGSEMLIKVILLDVRYNRDPQSLVAGLLDMDVTPGFDDMLGEEQWKWLDNQLSDHTPVYTLLVSATQFIADDRRFFDNWFQNSLDRMFDMIKSHKKSGVVFLSGDVHLAEVLKYPCPEKIGYRGLYEFTSSGMTHFNPLSALYASLPTTYNSQQERFFGKNFAVLKLEKEEDSLNPPKLVFEARNMNGKVVLTKEVPYSDLVYNETLASAGCSKFNAFTPKRKSHRK